MPCKHPARPQHESRRHPAAFFVRRKHAEKPHRTHDSRRAAPTAAPSAYPTPKRAGTKPSRNADRITDQPTDRRTAGKAAGSPTGREEAPTPARHSPSRRSPSRSPADANERTNAAGMPYSPAEAKHTRPRRNKHDRQHDQRNDQPSRHDPRRSRADASGSRPAYQPDRNPTEQPPSGKRGEPRRSPARPTERPAENEAKRGERPDRKAAGMPTAENTSRKNDRNDQPQVGRMPRQSAPTGSRPRPLQLGSGSDPAPNCGRRQDHPKSPCKKRRNRSKQCS